MKFIIAIIQPHKLDEVRDAIGALDISGMTVTEVRGYGRQRGHTEIYRGAEYEISYVPKLKLEIAVPDDKLDKAVDAIRETGMMERVITNGWGGGSAELQAIERGVLDLTVMRMNDDNGVAMAEAVVLAQSGAANKVPHIYSGDMVLITKEMSSQEVGGLKTRAFRYSK